MVKREPESNEGGVSLFKDLATLLIRGMVSNSYGNKEEVKPYMLEDTHSWKNHCTHVYGDLLVEDPQVHLEET